MIYSRPLPKCCEPFLRYRIVFRVADQCCNALHCLGLLRASPITATENGNELAAFQMIALHVLPLAKLVAG